MNKQIRLKFKLKKIKIIKILFSKFRDLTFHFFDLLVDFVNLSIA